MNLEIFSRPFFTNYIVHPRSPELSQHDKKKAVIASIAIGIFSLGLCHAFCAIKFHGRRVSLINPQESSESVSATPKLFKSMHTFTDQENYNIACDLPFEQRQRKLQILRDLAEKGFVPAQYELGLELSIIGTDAEKAEGNMYLNRAADAGNVEACRQVCLKLLRVTPLTSDTKAVILKRAEVVFAAKKFLPFENGGVIRTYGDINTLAEALKPIGEWTVDRFLNDTTTPLDEMFKLAHQIQATPAERLEMFIKLADAGQHNASALEELGKIYLDESEENAEIREPVLNYLNQAADSGRLEACQVLCDIHSRQRPLTDEAKEEIKKRATPVLQANRSVVLESASSRDYRSVKIIRTEEALNKFLGINEESSETSSI